MSLDKVWVFGEANGDAVSSITLEMLAKARENIAEAGLIDREMGGVPILNED